MLPAGVGIARNRFSEGRRWSRIPLLLCRSVSGDLFIPEAVMGLRPGRGNFTANNGSKSAANHGRAHVDVNDEAADSCKRGGHMNHDGGIAQPPRNGFDEPEPETRDKQQKDAEEHEPEK